MLYEQAYTNFNSLTDAKLSLEDDKGFSERVWVKVIPGAAEKAVIINNFPLNPQYRLHDVVSSSGAILYRRWKTQVHFLTSGVETEELKGLYDQLMKIPDIEVCFHAPHIGSVLSKETEHAKIEELRAQIFSVLEQAGRLGKGAESVEPLTSIIQVDTSRFAKPQWN